jgi:thioesterase domain-containing protein
VVTFNNKGDLPPFFCVSGLGGNPMIFLQLSKLLGKNQPFYALQFRGVDGIMTPHNCVEDMATEFMRDIRKVQPEGPYYLGGYSFGGLVAYEMIQHLTKGGEPVGGLVLIDTFIPLHSKSVLKKSLLSRLSNLIPTGSGYNTKKLSDHLRVLGFQTRNKPDFANIFKNRFDLVASCNHLAGVQYTPQPTVANVLFIKSALGVPPDRYGHKLPFHSIHEWDNLIPPDRLDLRHTQTHHYELLNEPHLSETARNISGGLAALREKCGR